MEPWLLVWYGLSSFILGLMLFLPVRKLILAVSLNRYQRRMQEAIPADALEKLKQRNSVIAAIVSMTFAFLYTLFR